LIRPSVRIRLAAGLLLLCAAGTLWSQNSSRDPVSRGDFLTLKVAVFGPGDPLYVWWGHIGLIVEDQLSGKARFYDYGLFSFENDHFFRNFALGRLLYSCGVSPAEANISRYIRANRDVIILTLNLPPEKKEEVWRFAEWNVRPENRNYYYHHFRDNCATRIRDILDLATDGQFREYAQAAPGRFTLREHVRRHTWFSPFFDWFLMFLMGGDIDRPITVWDEMFLPGEIDRQIRDFEYTDSRGELRPLVSGREVINQAVNRPAVLEIPRKQWPRELALGAAAALLLGFFRYLRQKERRIGRISLGISQSLLGLFFGTAGSLLFFMSFFTDHDYTRHNLNLLFVNPLLLAAVPMGILAAAGRGGKKGAIPERLLRGLWTLAVSGAFLSLLLRIFPGIYHQNQVTLSLFIPPALALSDYPRWLHSGLKALRKHRERQREYNG